MQLTEEGKITKYILHQILGNQLIKKVLRKEREWKRDGDGEERERKGMEKEGKGQKGRGKDQVDIVVEY